MAHDETGVPSMSTVSRSSCAGGRKILGFFGHEGRTNTWLGGVVTNLGGASATFVTSQSADFFFYTHFEK